MEELAAPIPHRGTVEDFFACSGKNRVSDEIRKILSLEESNIVNVLEIRQAIRNVATYVDTCV